MCISTRGKNRSCTIPRYSILSSIWDLGNFLILTCVLTCDTLTTFSSLHNEASPFDGCPLSTPKLLEVAFLPLPSHACGPFFFFSFSLAIIIANAYTALCLCQALF